MIEAAILAEFVAQARLHGTVASSLTRERGEFHDRSARARAVHASRTRWLQTREAESSFPCGVVRAEDVAFPPDIGDRRSELPVIAAVLPEAIAFLVDPPETWPAPDPIEAGSVPRASLRAAEVVDETGRSVPEPAAESFDPEPDVTLVVSWADGEQRLLFRSAWLAWRAAHKLRAVTVPRT